MEKILSFKNSDYTTEGIHVSSGKFSIEKQCNIGIKFILRKIDFLII